MFKMHYLSYHRVFLIEHLDLASKSYLITNLKHDYFGPNISLYEMRLLNPLYKFFLDKARGGLWML